MPKGLQGFQKGHPIFKGCEKGWFKKGQKPIAGFKKGHTPWHAGKKAPQISAARLGQKVSEETREKIRKALTGRKLPKGHPFTIKGKIPTYTFPKGGTPWNKGMKGKYKLPEVSRKLKGKRGELARNWQGGKVSLRDRLKKLPEYKEWRKAVFAYDNWTCWICGEKGYLQPHHLKSFSYYPELAFKINNGITLCKFCHKTYTLYGGKMIKYGKNN